CALDQRRIVLTQVPPDYVQIHSGLGNASPLNIIVLPILFEGSVRAVVELASFSRFSATHQAFLDQLTETIGLVLNTIEANTLTENLLIQSQSQAQELQSRAGRLAEQNIEVERKNQEVERAKALVEEKAEQLAVSSKYKSEFFSNMSHELRTPLNSLLILARLLGDNIGGNLNPKQVQFAQTIYASGMDLLSLINDLLDLAKIEAGAATPLNIAPARLEEVREDLERAFRQVAHDKGLQFTITLDPSLPAAIRTDMTRLKQVLKNLLANAFKFTRQGRVSLDIAPAEGQRIAFAVVDTGIGIPAEKQKIIFEAFQQADGSTSRQYGGTGLGLSISRELTRLLGGEIRVASEPGKGSSFTLYLPLSGEVSALAA
ncbi:MAG: sensor histidine kinase, partial [Burkholderiales bacterium]